MEEKNKGVVEEINPAEVDKKRRQQNMMIAGGVAILAFGALAYFLSKSSQPPQQAQPQQEEIKIAKRDTLQEDWKVAAEKRIAELQSQNEELRKKIEESKQAQQQMQPQQQIPSLDQVVGKSNPPLPPPPPPPPPEVSPQPVQTSATINPPQQHMTEIPELKIKKDSVIERRVPDSLIYYSKSSSLGKVKEGTSKEEGKEQEPQPLQHQPQLRQAQYSPNKEELKTVKSYIPAGTITPAVLLSGVDAPTGGTGATGPIPVLLKLQDLSILPNRFKSNIKECFVIGTAIGDLKSERAYIRLETLSCVRNDQTVIEKEIKGYVAGEDGKVGLTGRVVSKAGSAIARSILAGFVEGVARAFSMQNMVISVSPLGQTQTVNPDRTLQYGVGQGVAQGATKLVDFYLRLANDLVPVVEVNAGRKVDVILLKGVKLDEV